MALILFVNIRNIQFTVSNSTLTKFDNFMGFIKLDAIKYANILVHAIPTYQKLPTSRSKTYI